MPGIDYIGTDRVSIRRTGERNDPTITIQRLECNATTGELILDLESWVDLMGLVLAAKEALDFWSDLGA